MVNLHKDFHEIGVTGEDGDVVYICNSTTGASHELTKDEFFEYYEQISGTLYKMKAEYIQAVL